MANGLKLYDYWRSSASYRVRIALNLKGLLYEQHPIHLVRDGGEQHSPEYRAVNPQELVPVLVDGRRVIRQSLAIIEYLDETYDGEMKLLPATARDRARVRALAQMVACDIHPLNNRRVMLYLENKSYEEMEDILGINQNNLRVKMNRIKEKLRQLTKAEAHGT